MISVISAFSLKKNFVSLRTLKKKQAWRCVWDDFNSTMIYDPLIKDVTCLTFPQMHFVKRVYIRFQEKHAKSNTIRMGSVRFAVCKLTYF